MLLFADDIGLVPKPLGQAGEKALHKALMATEAWSWRWRLQFSAKKSKVLCFTNKRKKPKLLARFVLHSEFMEQVKWFDYLGLRWQENGKWHEQLEKVCNSAKRVVGLICSLLNDNCRPSFLHVRQLTHALIRTKFSYGMPIWSPSTKKGWRRLDSLVMTPMRRALRLPSSTSMQALMVETATLSMSLQYEKLTLAAAARGYTLHADHPTKQLLTWQVNQRVKAQSRTPLVTRAMQIADERGIDLDAVSDKKMLHKEFMLAQHRLFRLSGQCKLLRRLTNHPFDPGKLPMYDSPRTAALRAKLRLNRTNIKSSLLRQHIIKNPEDAVCPACKVKEDLVHVLFICPSLSQQRAALAVDVDENKLSCRLLYTSSWILGQFDSWSASRDKIAACRVSARFLSSIDSVRPL